MLQEEFEKRTGLSLSEEEFAGIHAIYMACGDDMDKDRFCKMWKGGEYLDLLKLVVDEKAFAANSLDNAIKKIRKMQDEEVSKNMDYVEFLLSKAEVYRDPDFRQEAVRLVGEREVVLAKLRMCLPLWEEDRKYIIDNM